MAKKTWKEKLTTKKEPKTKTIDFDFADIPAGSSMYISTPQIIQEYIQSIPNGSEVNIKTLRNDLAIANGADYTCPLTTGIFLRIIAESAYEDHQNGISVNDLTPFWRAIEAKSSLAKKLTFGIEKLLEFRNAEGLN